MACEKAKTDSDKAFGQKPQFGFRPENTNRSENSIQQSKQGAHRQSHEALAAQEKQKSPPRTKPKGIMCRYCNSNHWSDECQNFKSIDERKKQLKGSCSKCLKEGHYTRDCKSAKQCVYCWEFSVHHRSLCPSKFEKTIVKESVHVAEESEEATQSVPVQQGKTCLSIGETALMQTALTEVSKTTCGIRIKGKV